MSGATGRGAAWQRDGFGNRRSLVRIQSPRPFAVRGDLAVRVGDLLLELMPTRIEA